MVNDGKSELNDADSQDERLQVSCYAGYRGAETPRVIHWGAHRLKVRVVGRWQTPHRRCFKCLTSSGAVYDIYQERTTGLWHCASYTPSGGRF